MTEIPDEIREAGVAWVAEQTKHYSTESNLKTMACHDLMAGWVACYRHLTSQKPDGWCAWHPEKGFIVETTDPRKSEAIYSLRKMFIHPQQLTPANIAVVEKLGYEIIPVRLLKCEAADEQ